MAADALGRRPARALVGAFVIPAPDPGLDRVSVSRFCVLYSCCMTIFPRSTQDLQPKPNGGLCTGAPPGRGRWFQGLN